MISVYEYGSKERVSIYGGGNATATRSMAITSGSSR